MRSSTSFRALMAMLVILALTSSSLVGHTIAAPQHAKVYNIYLSNNYLGNDWRVQMEHSAEVLALKGPDAGRVNLHIVNVDNTVAAQIASLNNIIQTHPDAILIDAGSNDALNSTIARGCAQGIVMMSFDQVVSAPCAWKFDSGQNDQQPWGAEWLAATLHHKGNILIDRGLPGAPLSVGAIAVWNKIFAQYPKIHIVGYYAGQYALGPEQSAVAALLTAHPHIDGIMSQAYGVGAIAALKAAGAKPVPMIAATFNETMLACVQNHIGCLMSVNPTWLSGLAMKYAVDALDGKISKTARWVHDEVPPYSTNNVQIPGAKVKTVPVKLGVNVYPGMAGTLTLPVSPTWANITPQEANTGKV
ncbi:MAG TPA: substrate-binding domain-containing protein [Chloroflexota bacterium]|nr:substrate-binding domain-containing protein [Chloroflexota bacterium]